MSPVTVTLCLAPDTAGAGMLFHRRAAAKLAALIGEVE